MSKRKLTIGIDINEILRAKWVQFDKFYVAEFGEEGVPKENEYCYDYFNTYKFEDTVEVEKELKEPEDMPENINPIDYQVENNGDALADAFLFKTPKIIELNSKEVYNRFMYQDYCFEIHGSAPTMYKNMVVDVNNFFMKYKDTVNFKLLSVENYFSIPSTLFFLSKMTSRFKNISFVENPLDMWNEVDVLITTDPKILKLGAPWGKKLIKINRPYNEKDNRFTMESIHLKELINNPQFEKIIRYKSKK